MPIEIIAYRGAWAELYTAEATRLKQALGSAALRVEHVGSTAVPGLAAKDTVDIQVSVMSLEDDDLFKPQLESLDYSFLPDDEPAHRFFRLEDEGGRVLFHVHLCESRSDWERRHIAFRDYLREHPDTAREYEALKKSLAPRFEDANEYADAKSDFIRRVEDAAAKDEPPSSIEAP